MIDHRESVNIDDIKTEMYYTIPQIVGMLWQHKSTVIRWCESWKLRNKNFGSEKRKIRIIKWEHLKEFTNKK